MIDITDGFNRANGPLGGNWAAASSTTMAAGVNLYVSTAGNDLNDGSIGAPFRTIQKAATMVAPGTTVHVAPGVYNESGIASNVHGTAAEPIRFVSDTLHGAIIRPSPAAPTEIWINQGNWVTIEGFDIDGSLDGNLRVGLGIWGSNNWARRCRVHHLILNGATDANGGAGILCGGGFFNLGQEHVIDCIVHDIATPTSQRCHGIYTQQNGGSVLNNLVYGVNGIGITGWHDSSNITFAHNTVVACGVGLNWGGGDFYFNTAASGQIVANNIIANCPGGGIIENGVVTGPTVVTNNLSFNNGTNYSVSTTTPANQVTGNPNFINSAGNDYHLQATSPARDAGSPTYATATDLDGLTRILPPDCGAFDH